MPITMKNRIIIPVSIIAFIISGIIFFDSKNNNSSESSKIISVSGRKFLVEFAVTSDEKSRGLSLRDNLCLDCGMIFKFDEPGEHAFWMKDMRFPLDIIWIRDGKVVYIERSIPADSKAIMKPSVESDSVLEVNAGIVDEVSLKVGDWIKL